MRASLEAMAGGSLRFYLDAAASGERRRLTRHKSSKPAFVVQTVNFADRTDAGWMPPTDLVTRSLVTHNDIMFVSEPLTKPSEFNGLFSGRLDFTVNKMDMDLNIMLYERLAERRLRSPVQSCLRISRQLRAGPRSSAPAQGGRAPGAERSRANG